MLTIKLDGILSPNKLGKCQVYTKIFEGKHGVFNIFNMLILTDFLMEFFMSFHLASEFLSLIIFGK